ncbi:hypothetical protein BH10ACT4_BH10ACT4_13410 [soil metagenome]
MCDPSPIHATEREAGPHLRYCPGMKPHSDATRMPTTDPLVGGESARLIADAIRSFPISLTRSGSPQLHNIATGQTRAMIQRAYERIEIEVMDELAHCGCPGEHRTLDVHEYEWLIYSELMEKAKAALGETGRVEALWSH